MSLFHTISTLLLLPAAISALSLDCKHIRAGGQSFDLRELAGPKNVHILDYRPPSILNTTFTLDICKPLPRTSGVAKEEECAQGSRVCAIQYNYNFVENKESILEVIPIAGEYTSSHGRALDPKFTRLKDSESTADSEREGVRVELHGGRYPDTRSGQTQKAIIEFVCDRDVTGNEGFEDEEETAMFEYGRMRRREDDKDDEDEDDPELPDMDKGKSLQLVSYKDEKDAKVLRLNWRTKYACESAVDEPADGDKGGKKKSTGWGFFTWFIIILFLLAASYIIFGSWLNYNRYGARGWDLIPHGDFIRDIPYLVKEWTGNMVDKLKGSGTRGGYSAV